MLAERPWGSPGPGPRPGRGAQARPGRATPPFLFIISKFKFFQKKTDCVCVCVFITAGPMIKLCAGGEGDSEGHVLNSLEGLSFPVVHVGVVECATASPYTYSSTHRFPDELTPIEAHLFQ